MTRIPLLVALLGTGCVAAPLEFGGREPLIPPLPDWPDGVAPIEEGAVVVRIYNGALADFHERITPLRSGPLRLAVHNDVPGAYVEEHGLDLAGQATALWIHGRGAARDWLPQFAFGPINGGIHDDWAVDLPPGDYEIEETLLGRSRGIWRVR